MCDTNTRTDAALVQVLNILQSAKDRVKGLLRRRIAELHAVATALIKDETLDHAQVLSLPSMTSDCSPDECGLGRDPLPCVGPRRPPHLLMCWSRR